MLYEVITIERRLVLGEGTGGAEFGVERLAVLRLAAQLHHREEVGERGT